MGGALFDVTASRVAWTVAGSPRSKSYRPELHPRLPPTLVPGGRLRARACSETWMSGQEAPHLAGLHVDGDGAGPWRVTPGSRCAARPRRTATTCCPQADTLRLLGLAFSPRGTSPPLLDAMTERHARAHLRHLSLRDVVARVPRRCGQHATGANQVAAEPGSWPICRTAMISHGVGMVPRYVGCTSSARPGAECRGHGHHRHRHDAGAARELR